MKVIGNLTKDAIIRAAVSEGINVTQAVGTSVVMNAGSTTGFAAAFDSSTGKVVIAFSDGADSNKGKAIVGTVDAANNSISFGSEVTFQNSEITGDEMDCVFDSNANKVVIFYTDTNNPGTDDRTGTAIVGTVSGTSISFGTKAAFESGKTKFIVATFDSNSNKFVVAYEDDDNSDYGTAAVGTISGTDISFGTPVVFDSQATEYHGISFDSTANKVVIAYRDFGASIEGRAVVGTVSGTSISFGSTVAFTPASADYFSPVYDSANNKTVIFYRDANNSDHGTAKVGTVSGTSISFGSAVVFNAGNSRFNRAIYDSNAEKILVLFNDTANSNRPTIIIGTVSGTSISFGSETVVMDVQGATINPAVAFDSTNNRVVLSYIDTTGSDNGMAQVIRVGYTQATGGTIANGSSVIVNANGTVSSVGQSALTEAKGSEVEFEAGGTYNQGVVYDSANDKVVIVYSDAGNSDYGTAIVGTVSGDSISFGTAVVFESATTSFIAPVFDSSNNKIVVAYRDGGNSGAGTAIVGTVSGTSISFGTAVVFESGNSNNFIDASFDTSANKVVIVFRDNDDSNNGKAIVGTVSGTSISFGSANTFLAATTQNGAIAYDVANNRHVIACQYTSGIAIVATVTGTSIAFGSQSEFETGSIIHTKALYDPNIERVHIFYGDAGDSDKGKAVIGTVSDTSISFTGQATFYGSAQVTDIGASFNTSINAITLATRDNGGALNMYTSTATTSAYTFGSAFSIDTGVTNGNVNNAHVSTADRTVLAFTDVGDSNKGKAVVYTGAGNVTNLTTENFVGFMDGAALDGTNGEILSSCAIARNQTSLTPGQTYFVSPTDGALSLTAGDPSVTAGTAISNTELIVKG